MSSQYQITVIPAATGRQLVRTSLPLSPGVLPQGQTLVVHDGTRALPTGVRVLTWHPGGAPRSVRRALVTWVAEFANLSPVEFTVEACDPAATPLLPQRLPVSWTVQDGLVQIAWEGGPIVTAGLLAPPAASTAIETEVIERHGLYHWERLIIADPQFPRVIEIRADALGQVVLVGHVQRALPGNDYAPDLGWALDFRHLTSRLEPVDSERRAVGESRHRFADGAPCAYFFENPGYVIYHPAAPHRRKGEVAVCRDVDNRTDYRYLRANSGDLTPFQSYAWHRFEAVIAPDELACLTPTLACPHTVQIDPSAWDALYATGEQPVWPLPELAEAVAYHHDLIQRCAAEGDDWGNMIGYDEQTRATAPFTMERLNHCPPIFFEGWRSGDARLVETAVRWCMNFHDKSIWWGPQLTGGTRYNIGSHVDHHPPAGDPNHYRWRSNRTIDFCTKGYDTFFLAYEETGDPDMLRALTAQVAAASDQVHVDRGECRNIGDVRDFVRLYRYTGERHHLDQALRLFRELTTKLWPNHLFDQAGKPPTAVLPFIDNDSDGIRHGYGKPYIMGYALAGLPELLQECPDEPRLRQVVQAVADFMAESQDPAGGWRGPHPRSSSQLLGFMEFAWQLVQADHAVGIQEAHLDAIERALRARILGWLRSGMLINGLDGWERAAGITRPLHELYAHPQDRDGTRDYDEGDISLGPAWPDTLVYFPEVLEFYLRHRSADRLLALADDEPLARILRRLPDPGSFQADGVRDGLPVFRERVLGRLRFELAWPGAGDFDHWKREARAKVRECLLAPPPDAAFAPRVLAEEQRNGYVARKIAFNLTGDSRVLAYQLVPDGPGPFPAVLLLHDHGARFDIGKEKVIKPFGDTAEHLASALEWIDQCYGGRFIGDELARRGYVCLATDMLNWSDRGGGGHESQQALAANLFHLGMSFAGVIAWEDLRAAEFLAACPEVDPRRVAAMGLSVGSFRTWQLAALSDRIRAGVAICWMATVHGLMVPGNNQTRGQSAYTMIHPGLHQWLDYPDVASLACPKPMLFFNGRQDGLFPVDSVQFAYEKMRAVWDSQGVADHLVTKLWDVPHEFNLKMQEEAFEWLALRLEGK